MFKLIITYSSIIKTVISESWCITGAIKPVMKPGLMQIKWPMFVKAMTARPRTNAGLKLWGGVMYEIHVKARNSNHR